MGTEARNWKLRAAQPGATGRASWADRHMHAGRTKERALSGLRAWLITAKQGAQSAAGSGWALNTRRGSAGSVQNIAWSASSRAACGRAGGEGQRGGAERSAGAGCRSGTALEGWNEGRRAVRCPLSVPPAAPAVERGLRHASPLALCARPLQDRGVAGGRERMSAQSSGNTQNAALIVTLSSATCLERVTAPALRACPAVQKVSDLLHAVVREVEQMHEERLP